MKFLKTSACVLALATACASAAPALANGVNGVNAATGGDGASLHAGSLEVPVNKSQVVTADRAIGRAMIGNAEIADVLPISDRSVYVLGKQFGTTSLTLYDRTNRVIAVMDVAVGPDVDGLRKQLADHLPGSAIEAQLSNGSVVLTGMVNDAGAASRAAQLAKAFAGDKVVNMMTQGSSQQVMLEVRFAEVNRSAGEKLSVSGLGLSRGGSFSFLTGSNAGGAAAVDAFGTITKSFHIGDTNIDATLDMLEKKGLSKTLAEPTLIALSGERASFLAGGEFPIPVDRNNNSDDVTIEYKSFGVSLSFTPTVLSDKVISLLVEPEVSSLDPSASVSVNGIIVPGLRTRRANTTVELRDGESFAIAGLLSKDFQTTVRQIPLLGSLPIIGALFRSSGFQKDETELLIVVTPRLVSPIKPEQVRLPTDRIKDPKPMDVLIDGEGYHPQALEPQAGEAAKKNGEAADAAPAKKEQGYEF